LPLPKVDNFYFNPNTISADSLVDLGLSPKQAQVIINYRNKGGKFKIADDFSRIHVIDSTTFHRLKPWIRIPKNTVAKVDSFNVAKIPIRIELNSADSASLTKLKGIGRSFARRIVAYRDLLGGFYSINQLSEVYGLTPEIVNSIRPNIWVDSSSIRILNLNLISYEELKQHPYLTDYQAKSIIYYRSKQRVIAKPIDLLNNKIIPPDRYQKIAPYFDVK
jgi:DNA uptake protein ComE-like DNA-binding protein